MKIEEGDKTETYQNHTLSDWGKQSKMQMIKCISHFLFHFDCTKNPIKFSKTTGSVAMKLYKIDIYLMELFLKF